jgi:hypothetical protein
MSSAVGGGVDGPLYEVTSAAVFDDQVQRQAGDMERWDEIWFGYDYILALNPHLGEPVPGTPFRAMHVRTIPILTVYYEIDEMERKVLLCYLAAVG